MAQSIVTGEPAFTITAVRGLAAQTRRTSSSWRPGRSIVVRSNPSVSHSSFVPTITTATSAAAAAATARSIRSAGSGERMPTRIAANPFSATVRQRMCSGTGTPAVHSIVSTTSMLP